jgi:protein PhnA
MLLEQQLQQRSHNACEICQSEEPLEIYAVPPQTVPTEDNSIQVCGTCASQIEKPEEMDTNHWRCLTASMWSEVPAVQVVSWRMLNRLSAEGWAADLLDMMYMEEETLEWAKSFADEEKPEVAEVHKDALGSQLLAGDSVVLTKTLDVKGSSLNAKLGTVVKNIRLVENNTDQIEGRIEGQVIVILTKYVRKQN